MKPKPKTSNWVLCPSKSFPGEYYYFNLQNGATAWSKDLDRSTLLRDTIQITDKSHTYPEPSNPPANKQPSTSNVPLFGQAVFPKYVPRNDYVAQATSLAPPINNYVQHVSNYVPPVNNFVPSVNNYVPNGYVPHVNEYVPNIIGIPLQIPMFVRNLERKMTVDQGIQTKEVGNEQILVKACPTPLSKRFINFDQRNLMEKHIFGVKSFAKNQLQNQPSNTTFGNFLDTPFQLNTKTFLKEPTLKVNDRHTNLCHFKSKSARDLSNLSVYDNKTIKNSRGFSKDTRESSIESRASLKGTRESLNNSRGSLKDSRESLKESRGSLKYPRGSLNDIQGSLNNCVNKDLDETDLRHVLVAKKRRNSVDCSFIWKNKEEINTAEDTKTKTDGKRVTFNLTSPESTSVEYDHDIESTASEPVDITARVSLPRSEDVWYLVPDADVMVEDTDLVMQFVRSDSSCRLLIPVAVQAALTEVGLQGSTDVKGALRVMETAPECVLQSAEEDVDSMFVNQSILNCCLQAMEREHKVFLLTNDIDLYNEAKDMNIDCCTTEEIKHENQNITTETENWLFLDAIHDLGLNKNEHNINNIEQKMNNEQKLNKNGHKLNKHIFNANIDKIKSDFDTASDKNSVSNLDVAINKLNIKTYKHPYIDLSTKRAVPNDKINIKNCQENLVNFKVFIDNGVNIKTKKEVNLSSNNTKFLINKQTNISTEILNDRIQIKQDIRNVFTEDVIIKNTKEVTNNNKSNNKIINNDKHSDNIEEELEEYAISAKFEERVRERMGEFICCFTQIFEDILTSVLLDSPPSPSRSRLPPPWSSHETLEILSHCARDETVMRVARHMLLVLFRCSCPRGNLLPNMQPKDFTKILGCGILLLQALQSHSPSEDITESLSRLVSLRREMCSETDRDFPEGVSTLCIHSAEAEGSNRTPFVKKSAEIVRYLKKHYQQWSACDYTSSDDESKEDFKVVRTIGKNINMLKIDKAKTMTFNVAKEKTVNDKIETENKPKADVKNIKTDDVKNKSKDITQSKEITKKYDLNKIIDKNTIGVTEGPKVVRNIGVIPSKEDELKKFDNQVNGQKTDEIFDETLKIDKDTIKLRDDDDDRTKVITKINTVPAFEGKLNKIFDETKTSNDKADEYLSEDFNKLYSIFCTVEKSPDSGFENDNIAYTFIKSFLAELSDSLTAVSMFLNSSMALCNGDICAQKKQLIQERAVNAQIHIRRIIDNLGKVINREVNESLTIRELLKNGVRDPNIMEYRQVITKCQKQAMILETALELIQEFTKC